MTLGELIDALERADASVPVRFDFNGATPGRFASYRGYYSELAIGFANTPRTVGDLLREARAAVGETFQGYKGGDFVMRLGTDVYAAEWGEWPGRSVVAAEAAGDTVLLVTREEKGW